MSDDRQNPERNAADEEVLRASRKRTRRSFAVGAVAAAAGYGLYHWINNARVLNGQPSPLQRMFRVNAAVSRALGEEHILSPTYSPERAQKLRVNGVVGLDQDIVLASWRLQVAGVRDAARHPRYVDDLTKWQYRYVDAGTPQPTEPDRKSSANAKLAAATDASGQPLQMPPDPKAQGSGEDISITFKVNHPPGSAAPAPPGSSETPGQHRRQRGDDVAGPSESALYDGTPGLLLAMDDLQQLPRVELVTQFKCIEGWSQIVQWRGIRMRDFIEAYPPAPLANGKMPRYVYMETPDGFYYNGYDLNACRHPQTLLVTEMGGQALAQEHGAPMRLHLPIKYGYKQIKRIGLIAYTDMRPDDYWAKLGYDWFGGL